MTTDRPVVLAPSDYFLPGYKAGGPIRTLGGLIEGLEGEFLFKVLTRDRDLGDVVAYDNIPVNTWQTLAASQIMYLPPGRLNAWAMWRLLAATDYDVLYINSCFSVPFSIVPLLLRRCALIPRRPVIIGPRGELAAGALGFKSGSKRLYIALARLLGLTRAVVWQASGTHEARDIRHSFGEDARVVIAPDLTPATPPVGPRLVEKQSDHLRLLFLSRISRMKNLDGALALLRGITGSIHFSIYGPPEDPEYWKRCQDLVSQLPENVTVDYGGAIRPDRIGALMAEHDLFFLPTFGEAFGHVILEAMASGCPVLISDRTRWRGLEAAGVGWDVSLEDPDRFQDVLRRCIAMDAAAWRELSERARKYAAERLSDPAARETNLALFQAVHRGQATIDAASDRA